MCVDEGLCHWYNRKILSLKLEFREKMFFESKCRDKHCQERNCCGFNVVFNKIFFNYWIYLRDHVKRSKMIEDHMTIKGNNMYTCYDTLTLEKTTANNVISVNVTAFILPSVYFSYLFLFLLIFFWFLPWEVDRWMVVLKWLYLPPFFQLQVDLAKWNQWRASIPNIGGAINFNSLV